MPAKNYAFVDRICPVCHGEGGHPSISREVCPECHGSGLVGGYEEVPDIRPHFHPTQLSNTLRSTREARKVSMRTLALHIGVSVWRLSDIERGFGDAPTPEEENPRMDR